MDQFEPEGIPLGSRVTKTTLAIAVIVLVALAGCSTFIGTEHPKVNVGIAIDDNSTGATNVTQSVSIKADESTAGEEWAEIGATHPRDRFTVHSSQHDQIQLGGDTDGDGKSEQTFNETHVSGVNNNAFSFAVTLDTGYTLEEGDIVMVEYSAIDNPSDPGDYTVEVRLNDRQTTNATVTIERPPP